MATVKKLDGLTRDGRQAYLVRWSERTATGGWRDRERRVYGQAEAQELAREKAATHQGRASKQPASRITLGEAAEAWLREYATKQRPRAVAGIVEERSWESAAREIEYLVRELGADTRLDTITPKQIADIVDGRVNLRTGKPAAYGTRQRMAGVLKAWASHAVREEWTPKNLASELPSRYGPFGSGRRAFVPSAKVLDAIAAELDRPTRPVKTRGGAIAQRPKWLNIHDPEIWRPSDRLWLFALTGLDFSEAAGLRINDVAGRLLTLKEVLPREKSEPKATGKTHSRVPRDVPYPETHQAILDRLISYSRCDRLLTGPDGQPLSYSSWSTHLRYAATTAGHPEYTTKALRHFAASLWIKAGAKPLYVMRAGGWASLAMVSAVYGHLFESDIENVARDMEGIDWSALD